MHIFDLKASVGYGASLDINALIFIIHLSKQPENVYWSVSYDYSQLSRIDQLIAKNCNYIRHSHFPRLYEDDIKPLVKYLLDIESGSKLLRPIGGLQTLYHRSNKSEKLIITKLNRLREVVESWFHLILLRFHVMPFKVKEELMNIFCLPYGPVKETDAVKFGLDKILSETKLAPHRSVLTKASMNAAYVEVVQREVELADSLPPLLYVSVIKGPRNERGKQEYTIDIRYSIATEATHSVNRSYSQFRSLRDTLMLESNGHIEALLLHKFPECSLSDSLFSISEEGIYNRAVHFNLWFSELLWNFPHLGSRSAQLAVLKFLAIPSELWHEINRPDPAVHTDSETPRPSMMARDSSSTIKTPTRSPGLSLLSSRALVSDAEEFLVTAEEEEEEVDSVWARRDARDKIRAHQEKSTPKAQRQSSLTSFDSGRPTTDTGMIDAAAAVDALASLTKRLGLGLVEGGRAPNIEFFGQPTNDALESSALSFHAIATASMEHANHHTSFSPLFHFRFAVLNTTMCGENPLQASTDRRYNPSGSAIYRGGICISELASRTTNTEPILETVVGQDSDTLLTPAEIFHWGKNKRSSMRSFKLMKSSKMLKDGSQFESMSHPYKLIRHQEYDFSYFETVKGSRKQSYQSSFSQ